MTDDARASLRLVLLWLRLALGAHALYWGLVLLTGGRAITQLPFAEAQLASTTLACVILGTGVATLLGLWRPLSYGVLLFLQAMVTFASYASVLVPLSALAGRTVATIPLLAASALLFVMRDQDTLISTDIGLKTLSRRLAQRPAPPGPAHPAAEAHGALPAAESSGAQS